MIAPPSAPLIATAADALAVTLNATGRVDVDHLAELFDRDPATALAQLGEAVFRNPSTEAWETDDAYLSGCVRTKLALAEAAAEQDPQYARTGGAAVGAARGPPAVGHHREAGRALDSGRRHRGVRLDIMGTETRVRHIVEIASWSAGERDFFRIRPWSMNQITRLSVVNRLVAARGRHGCGTVELLMAFMPAFHAWKKALIEGLARCCPREGRSVGGRCCGREQLAKLYEKIGELTLRLEFNTFFLRTFAICHPWPTALLRGRLSGREVVTN